MAGRAWPSGRGDPCSPITSISHGWMPRHAHAHGLARGRGRSLPHLDGANGRSQLSAVRERGAHGRVARHPLASRLGYGLCHLSDAGDCCADADQHVGKALVVFVPLAADGGRQGLLRVAIRFVGPPYWSNPIDDPPPIGACSGGILLVDLHRRHLPDCSAPLQQAGWSHSHRLLRACAGALARRFVPQGARPARASGTSIRTSVRRILLDSVVEEGVLQLLLHSLILREPGRPLAPYPLGG
jgi:hypothetical protein